MWPCQTLVQALQSPRGSGDRGPDSGTPAPSQTSELKRTLDDETGLHRASRTVALTFLFSG